MKRTVRSGFVGMAFACVLCCWAAEPTVENGEPTLKEIEKQIQEKQNEIKGLRLRNPAHIWGDESQSTAIRKRMPIAGEKKYYTSQIVDVRPFCVCKHAQLKNGGTKARHSKNSRPDSLTRESSDCGCRDSELCPAWKQWNDAKKKVADTEKMNNEIDPLYAELEKLEAKKKELMDRQAERRKTAAKTKGNGRSVKTGKVK